MNKKIAEELLQSVEQCNYTISERICSDEIKNFRKYTTFALFSEFFCDRMNKESIEDNLNCAYKSLKNALGVHLYEMHKNDIDEIFLEFPKLRKKLLMDAEAIYEGDPASAKFDEVITMYPGFYAILTYRIAHEFYIRGMKSTARILSEIAHSKTGIDINPGAVIGDYFFIDHGTGIVIGETAIIGNRCKLYQGVTLGALSLRKGRQLEGLKRHPTLLDNVTIYSGASIFGGETIIGNNVTIGSNVEIKESVPDNAIVRGNCCK